MGKPSKKEVLSSLYKTAFASEEGKKVLSDLIEKGNIFKPTLVQGTNGLMDPLHSAFEEGKRTIILYVMEMLNVNNAQLFAIRKAQIEERIRENEQRV